VPVVGDGKRRAGIPYRLPIPCVSRGTSRTGSLVDGAVLNKELGLSHERRRGCWNWLWVEVEPERRVPSHGTTGESGRATYQQLKSALRQKAPCVDGRHGLESGRPSAESAGFVERAGHRYVIEPHRGLRRRQRFWVRTTPVFGA